LTFKRKVIEKRKEENENNKNLYCVGIFKLSIFKSRFYFYYLNNYRVIEKEKSFGKERRIYIKYG